MIHPTSIIEQGAQIGKNVSIGAFTHIGKDVIIKDNCKIANSAVINGKVTIDEATQVFSNATIGHEESEIYNWIWLHLEVLRDTYGDIRLKLLNYKQ